MLKVAKFVVIINENVAWMENQAINFYTNLFQSQIEGKKYTEENLSREILFKIQNDFSIEMLMVYGDETPLSFLKMNSSRLFNQNLGAFKPLNISTIIYDNTEDIMVLLKRVEEVAYQRKHDMIWVKVLKTDTFLIQKLQTLTYEEFSIGNTKKEQETYFKKSILI